MVGWLPKERESDEERQDLEAATIREAGTWQTY